MLQYDVSDPFHPKKTGSVHIGGIVRRTPHPSEPGKPLRFDYSRSQVARLCASQLPLKILPLPLPIPDLHEAPLRFVPSELSLVAAFHAVKHCDR
jgi:hypothetical protein